MPKIPYSKRKDGRYYKQIIIGVDENGKKKVKTLYDRDWRTLDKKVKEFTVELEQGRCVAKSITLGECIDLWLKGKKDVCAGTIRVYNTMRRRVDPISHIAIDKIRPIQIENLYAEMYERGVTTSIKGLSWFLKCIYNFAIINQYTDVNVAERARVPKISTKRRRSLTDDERSALMAAFGIFDDFERVYVGIAYYAGLRRNEILALTTDDIDLSNNVIKVNKTLTMDERWHTVVQNHPKSKAGIRHVPICKQLSDILNAYLENRDCPNGKLFTTVHGNDISNFLFEYRWKNIVKKINMFMPEGKKTDITSHCLRHNWATDLVYAGIPLKSVQYVMGHEKIDMTLGIYTDIRIDNNSIIDTMSRFWN